MMYLSTQPQLMAAAAADVAGIGAVVSEASAAAAAPTTAVVAAAADEVSAAIAEFASAFGREYQMVFGQVAAFHREFAQALTAAAHAYSTAEIANTVAVSSASTEAMLLAPEKVALMMGGTGNPLPSQFYVDTLNSLFIQPIAPGAIPEALYTPAELYPVTGVRNLPFESSVSEGVDILNNAIMREVAAGNQVTVFGNSQSAVIASLAMSELANMGSSAPSTTDLHFALIANLMNPNGGLFQRFAGLTFPALGLDFYGSTPDNLYPTTIYTREYDGFASFPQYPLNFVSVLNALAGIGFVHFGYDTLTPDQIDSAVTLPTEGPTMTTYKMIRTEDLPLLEPVRAIPVVGEPLASLVQPNLKVIVNLGYGDPAYGYSTGPANVPTPFGLFPPVSLHTVIEALTAGTHEGIADFAADLHAMSTTPISPPSLVGPPMAPPTAMVLPTPIEVANAATSIISTDYALLLPAADIAMSVFVSLPAYDATLIVRGLEEGSLLNAIGYPITANVALLPLAGGLGAVTVVRALASNISDIQGLFS
ncbi:PE-PPE domain-containing protein [Mycobacterium spongiae]|uniref:PE-PPE domain-containing protein n=1 Tax=Mycobacterium spongiae TaxID=886343 RepID=A0A975K2R2_9MYCO|nr:PE-PPE domain-containing protein [Mycobacterium spongiae]